MQICYVVIFYGACHIVLDVDKDFKERSDVFFEVAAKHVNNLSIALNSQTTNDVKSCWNYT